MGERNVGDDVAFIKLGTGLFERNMPGQVGQQQAGEPCVPIPVPLTFIPVQSKGRCGRAKSLTNACLVMIIAIISRFIKHIVRTRSLILLACLLRQRSIQTSAMIPSLGIEWSNRIIRRSTTSDNERTGSPTRERG